MAATEVFYTQHCIQPTIDFDSYNKDYDEIERLEFWETTREWLKTQGYILSRRFVRDEEDENLKIYAPVHESPTSQQHPYAPFSGDNSLFPDHVTPQLAERTTGQVMFAQDSLSRHVAIKIVKDGTQEYRILRRLSEEPSLLSVNNFPHIMPVLDFLKCDNHWFVVMPRWGHQALTPWYNSTLHALQCIHSLLKALAFLHERLIAHRDIREPNYAVNHIASSWLLYSNKLRPGLRQKETFLYALFDFDISIMFSPDTSTEDRRLPYWDSWDGGYFEGPYDTAQGEFDYDPFAFDVATLGIMIAVDFQHLSPIIPMLAPLLDKMLTWDISGRFTASEALDFFEAMYAQVTPKQLATLPPEPTPDQQDWETHDRWNGLPADFVEKWKSFRIPKPPLITRMLRKICKRPWLHLVVISIRRAARMSRNVLKLFV